MLTNVRNVYFSGINGIGMSGLAKILVKEGYNVAGSDLERKAITQEMEEMGIKIYIGQVEENVKDKGIDYVVGADARGFIFGAAIAYNIGAGFVPARKPGKLPAEVESVEYSLEYGKNSIEIHKDAFKKGSKILIVDDLLATGGTAKAMVQLVEKLEAKVYELAFMIELTDLKGRELLEGYDVYSQLKY